LLNFNFNYMRKILFIILGLSSFLVCSALNVQGKDAIALIRKIIPQDSLNNLNVYISKQTFKPHSIISTFNKELISPAYESWFVFIDDLPYHSWTHSCRYLFINASNGRIEVINGKFPPNIELMDVINIKSDETEGVEPIFQEYKPQISKSSLKSSAVVPATGNRYAVVISGGMDRTNNYRRYWNDCSEIYRCLINRYGFTDANIYVLMSDGTDAGQDRRIGTNSYDSSPLDLDGDGDNDIDFSATKANITTVFNRLHSIVTTNDYLFIYSTDHGNQISGWDAELILWGETITDKAFAVEVNKVNAGCMGIVMEQCYSGGFIDDLWGNGRTVATACQFDETSCGTGYLFDDFVHHWTAAVNRSYPDGTVANADNNGDGFITLQEAFNFATSHDECDEHPQYSSINPNYGTSTTLRGLELCSTAKEIKDETISSNRSITYNCKIRVQNIIIQNNSNVTFDAGLDVTINGPFTVQSGSTLIIK